jgi:hypothetical protein
MRASENAERVTHAAQLSILPSMMERMTASWKMMIFGMMCKSGL